MKARILARNSLVTWKRCVKAWRLSAVTEAIERSSVTLTKFYIRRVNYVT
jgi:hypothetical protein